jgi:hypothetical protein
LAFLAPPWQPAPGAARPYLGTPLPKLDPVQQ